MNNKLEQKRKKREKEVREKMKKKRKYLERVRKELNEKSKIEYKNRKKNQPYVKSEEFDFNEDERPIIVDPELIKRNLEKIKEMEEEFNTLEKEREERRNKVIEDHGELDLDKELENIVNQQYSSSSSADI